MLLPTGPDTGGGGISKLLSTLIDNACRDSAAFCQDRNCSSAIELVTIPARPKTGKKNTRLPATGGGGAVKLCSNARLSKDTRGSRIGQPEGMLDPRGELRTSRCCPLETGISTGPHLFRRRTVPRRNCANLSCAEKPENSKS